MKESCCLRKKLISNLGSVSALLCISIAFSQSAFSEGGGIVTDDTSSLFSAGKKATYSPYAQRNFPDRPLWGDTHLHTAISFDAGAFGATLLPPDAYRFSKGEGIVSSTGQPARLSSPLDFLVVDDSSDNMGLFPELLSGPHLLMASGYRRGGTR